MNILVTTKLGWNIQVKPAKNVYRPFGPQQVYSTYLLKIVFTQASSNCLINNKTKNYLHSETIILNNICGDLISHGLSN